MTPYGVILLLFGIAKHSIPNEVISQNIVELDPLTESTISSISSLPNLDTTSNISLSSFNETLQRMKRHYRYNFFNSFINQRIYGNRIPQCPCVINPGSNKCIAYDSRYQAASVEEAIVSFQDFTADPSTSLGPLDEKTFLCRTLECQACAAIIIERLKKIGFLAWNAQLALNIPPGIDLRYCRRLRIARPHRTFSPPSKISPAMKAIILEGKRRAGLLKFGETPQQSFRGELHPVTIATGSRADGNQYSRVQPWSDSSGPQPWNVLPQSSHSFPVAIPQQIIQPLQVSYVQPQAPSSSYPTGPPTAFQQSSGVDDGTAFGVAPSFTWLRKSKRQAMGDRILGNRFVIGCVERGESESDESDMLTLCGACWTWRQLPEDYFPRLVNELVCKQGADGYCLSGWGSCYQKFRNLDVLRRVRGEWTPTTISTASCCDCRVKAGTEIHALVVGQA
uniref:Uncharacterized protein n=1 Tax=Parascaris univalens TaxID=6257 RepID=A0A915CDI8_PARUN